MPRPFAITVLGWLYIVVGALGLLRHGSTAIHAFHREDVWILLTEVLAIVAGAFLLRGANWARWLAVLWIAAHVVIAWLNGPGQALFHAIILVGIAILLFRADARAFFRTTSATTSPGA